MSSAVKRPSLGQLDVHYQHALRVLQCDGRAARSCGVRDEQIAVTHRPDHLLGGRRQVGPVGRLADPNELGRRQFRDFARPGGRQDTARLPQPAKLRGGRAHSVIERVSLRKLLIERGERALALHGVVLGGDIAEGADHDAMSGFGVFGVIERDGHPQPVPISVVHRNREAAVWFVEQFGESFLDLPASIGVRVGRWPPREDRFVGQALRTVTQDVCERGIDLDHRALLIADEETLLQRVDQGGTPAGVVISQPRQLDVGPHPGEEFGGGERLDEVVVGPGLQPFYRGLLPGAGRQQHHGHGRGAGIGPQRRYQLESVQPGHHHIADDQVGHVSADQLQGVSAIGDRVDLVAGTAQQAGQVFTHVGVVVCDENARRGVAARHLEFRIVGCQRRLGDLGGNEFVVAGNPAQSLL